MRNPIIRTIYLYLFALIGLGMLVVGASMLINLGLKTWIFTKADLQSVAYDSRPMPAYISQDVELNTVKEISVCSDKCELTTEQKQQIDEWLIDYQEWKENEKNTDPDFYIERNRQRQASTAVSLILVGLPLWLFHWFTIKRDIKRRKESQ